MKKGLLFAAALLSSAATFAQFQPVTATAPRLQPVQSQSLPQLPVMQTMARQGETPAQPRRSYATGNYYGRPAGAFYMGWGLNGYGTVYSRLMVPMGQDVNFVPSNQNTVWKLGGRYLENTGTYVFNVPYGGEFYAPVATVNTDSFSVGTNSLYAMLLDQGEASVSSYRPYSPSIHWGLVCADSISTLYVADDHAGFVQQGRTYSNTAGFGYLSNFTMFGTGTMDLNTEDAGTVKVTCQSIYQVFGTTAAPLYVERVFGKGKVAISYMNQTVCASGKPLNNGAKLTAYVTGVNTEERTNSQGQVVTVKTPNMDDIIATLTASEGDTLGFVNQSQVNVSDGQGNTYPYVYSSGTLLFANTVEDEFGGQTVQPFIIPAGKEFAVVIDGFANNGVQFSIDGFEMPDEDGRSGASANGYNVVSDGTNSTNLTFSSPVAAQVGLVGMYDAALAPAHPGLYNFEDESLSYNQVRVSADGSTQLTEGATGDATQNAGNGLPGVLVTTTMSYFDGNNNANYSIEGMPSWITGVQVAPMSQNGEPVYLLQFDCQALPAGTAGRAAQVKVVSDRGASSTPIYIMQGNATIADGISAISGEAKSGNGRTFNLAGQQVSKDYKGVVVRDGKKYLQK